MPDRDYRADRERRPAGRGRSRFAKVSNFEQRTLTPPLYTGKQNGWEGAMFYVFFVLFNVVFAGLMAVAIAPLLLEVFAAH
jgi:hypothetical protein